MALEFPTSKHFAILNKKNAFHSDLLQFFSKYIFSTKTIRFFVEQEAKRDTSIFKEQYAQSLRSMSSGERKVALFSFLLSNEPTVLIVEDFYENLDAKNQIKLEELLIKASHKTRIIQIVKKADELFSFIDSCFEIVDNNLLPFEKHMYLYFKSDPIFSDFVIPKTTTNYTHSYNTFVKFTDVTIQFFEKTILKNINWEIKFGEFWQLIGENGSGKTTLLSLITGDSNKAYGKNIVLFDKLKGTEENVWEIKKNIGYFTPNITELFNRRHSVLHMVLSGFYDSIGLYVKPLDIHVRLAHEWIQLLGLTSLSKVTFATLPLSQQRMVLIARAMVKHPPLLILDEPTSGLDSESANLLVSLINKISIETKTTIIYVSHKNEKSLFPDKTFSLHKTELGTVGKVL